MCGIAGLVEVKGQALPPQARDWLADMTQTMAHRGPDGQGHWREGPCALGHRRLSIIDLGTGAQPMEHHSGRLCVTFNGEIYNFQEIKAQLQALGQTFVTHSDTEVILGAWLAWGPACLERLEGMFALAIWDKKDQTLFAARDRFGKKPFFYTLQKNLLAFASELTALTKIPGLDFSIDPGDLARFLAYEYLPTPRSIYSQVHKLPPAHYLLLRQGRLTTHRYWSLPGPQPTQATETELAQELRRLLTQAVKRRMIADVPLGVFLSGGVDSSIVAGLMAQMAPRVKTFSIGFTEASYDESHYADLVAKRHDTDHHRRILSAEDCADLLPEIVRRFDEPMADPSIAPTYLLSRLTRENVTVALGGDGADELFAGYEHFIGFKLAQYHAWLPKPVKMLIEALCRLLPASEGYVNLRLGAQTFLAGAKAPPWLRIQTWLSAIAPQAQAKLWLKPDLALLRPENMFSTTRDIFTQLKTSDSLARALHTHAGQYLLDYILVKVDRCTMMHSLEARAPFLDRDLAEFAARLPSHYKLRGFKRKYLLKLACADLLPPQIQGRNKRGFLIPVARWLRGQLKPLVDELLGETHLRRQGLFNPAAVKTMVDRHQSGRADLRKELWTMLVLQLWLEHYKPRIS